MKTLEQLTQARDSMRRLLGTLDAVRGTYTEKAKLIQADGTRHPEYIKEKVGELRSAALGQLGKTIGDLRTLNGEVQAERARWQQTQFVLSRQRFHGDDALENSARSRYFAELSAMPAALLRMTSENAKAEGNMALLFQCYLADAARDLRVVDLRNVAIAEQTEALALLGECDVIPAEAENLVREINGSRPVDLIGEARARIVQPPRPVLTFDEPPPIERLPAEDPVNGAPGLPRDRIDAARTKQPAEVAP